MNDDVGKPPAGGFGGGGRFTPPPEPERRGGGISPPAVITAVVLLATLVVIGVTYIRKYTRSALTAEQKNTIGEIAKDVAMRHEADRRLCPSASRPVPASTEAIRGRKYQSTAADWRVDADKDAGFACLRFEMLAPQYYQYDYKATATSFVAIAHGDLDADGELSRFEIDGRVENGRVVLDPRIHETDPEE